MSKYIGAPLETAVKWAFKEWVSAGRKCPGTDDASLTSLVATWVGVLQRNRISAEQLGDFATHWIDNGKYWPRTDELVSWAKPSGAGNVQAKSYRCNARLLRRERFSHSAPWVWLIAIPSESYVPSNCHEGNYHEWLCESDEEAIRVAVQNGLDPDSYHPYILFPSYLLKGMIR